ncbi:MAG: lysophospholipid acyltransferase family protein [Caldisericaceae bacterium]|nr:lysophospholipid acyltransferase family protein [Caldisericaceae bacterium]
MSYFWYKIGIFIALHFPRRVSYAIARALAFLDYTFFAGKRRRVHKTLRIIMEGKSEKEIKKTALRLYENFALNITDYFLLFTWNKENWQDFAELNGVDKKMKELASSGKGVMVSTAHIGNWEVAGFIVGYMGYKAHGIGLPQPNKKVDELYREVRRKGNLFVHPFKGGAIGVYKALKRGEIATIVSDRDINKDGVPVQFFGRCVTFPKGGAVLAYRTGAKAVFGCAIRVADGKYRAFLEPEIIVENRNSEEEFVKEYVQKFASILESYIRKYPDQWFHFFDYFEEFKCV